jgi:hypothetical protein
MCMVFYNRFGNLFTSSNNLTLTTILKSNLKLIYINVIDITYLCFNVNQVTTFVFIFVFFILALRIIVIIHKIFIQYI